MQNLTKISQSDYSFACPSIGPGTAQNAVKMILHDHCQISYGGGLGTSPCIMELTTQDPYSQKEHTELYKILKFRVNWANTEQDIAIQKLKKLVTN